MSNLFDDDDFDGERESEDEGVQKRATEVIKPLIPPDAQDRVQRAFRQWNNRVRDHIRNETALKLADGEGRNSVAVRVTDGYPVPLANLIDSYRDPVIWRLIVGQPKLGGILEGVDYLLAAWPDLKSWEKLPTVAADGRDSLEHVRAMVIELQKIAMAKEVLDKIREIRRDILGLYSFPKGEPCRVDLYWMPIAMFAAILDVPIEDLTLVVLAHELAHGYTHLGRDIDGEQWGDEAFQEAELDIVEGLAQFYAEVVTTRIAAQTPGPLAAYKKLLALQSGPYRAHENWVKTKPGQKGEIVRFAMVAARKMAIGETKQWDELLKKTEANLKS